MKNNDIQSLLRKVVDPLQPNDSMICIVRVYDSTSKTINVEPVTSHNFDPNTPNLDNYIYGVKLSAWQPLSTGPYGVLMIPKVGSYVIINTLENESYFVSMFSEIELFQFSTETGNHIYTNENHLNIISDELLIMSSGSPTYSYGFSKENKEMAVIGHDAKILIYNDKGGFSVDDSGLVILANTEGEVDIDGSGKITIKNSSKSIKKDVFDKIQSILTSLDAGLTGLGGVDPTRTSNIAALIPTLSALLKD